VYAQAQKVQTAIVERISNIADEMLIDAKTLFLLGKVAMVKPLYIDVYSLFPSIKSFNS